jgi:hypothetical protein
MAIATVLVGTGGEAKVMGFGVGGVAIRFSREMIPVSRPHASTIVCARLVASELLIPGAVGKPAATPGAVPADGVRPSDLERLTRIKAGVSSAVEERLRRAFILVYETDNNGDSFGLTVGGLGRIRGFGETLHGNDLPFTDDDFEIVIG